VCYERVTEMVARRRSRRSRSGRIGIYSYVDKLHVGLQQIMAGRARSTSRRSAGTTHVADGGGARK